MKEQTKRKIKVLIKKTLQLVFNPRFLLCFGIGWFITNGWSYVLLALGTWLQLPWMVGIATGYLALLWIPFTPEKLITTAIAIALLRWLFPDDEKTLGILRQLHQSAKCKWREYMDKLKARREKRHSEKLPM